MNKHFLLTSQESLFTNLLIASFDLPSGSTGKLSLCLEMALRMYLNKSVAFVNSYYCYCY